MEKNITKHCTYANVCRECSLFIIDQHLDNAANIWWNETCSNYMMQGYRPVTAVKIGITNEILLYNQTRCCKGQRTLFFTATNTVTTAMSRRETSFLPQKTATSAVPPLTSFGPPRIPSTEPGYNATSALIIGLVCAVLLCVLCFCACKYRRYRKTKLAMEKKKLLVSSRWFIARGAAQMNVVAKSDSTSLRVPVPCCRGIPRDRGSRQHNI
ncbi:uncharacterized protein LOC144626183 isoform X2 [Crassostrea virginica]